MARILKTISVDNGSCGLPRRMNHFPSPHRRAGKALGPIFWLSFSGQVIESKPWLWGGLNPQERPAERAQQYSVMATQTFWISSCRNLYLPRDKATR